MTGRRLRAPIAALAAAGIGIAGYLAHVHYGDTEAFCVAGGRSCEKARISEYAKLLGIPVGVLGLAGYTLILDSLWGPGEAGRLAGAILALSGFGFSA